MKMYGQTLSIAIMCLAVIAMSLLTTRYGPEKVPRGIEPKEYETFLLDSISIRNDFDIQAGVFHRNTFGVAKSHAPVGGNLSGVRFNVETVPAALPSHLHAPRLNETDVEKKLQASSALQYNILRQCDEVSEFAHNKNRNLCQSVLPEAVRIETISEPSENLIYQGGNGFLVACLTAFAQHLPLVLTPDHIWSLITYTFAKHVQEHAEELRSKFVAHEGKKRLLVATPAFFAMSDPSNNVTGATAGEWEACVFSQFSEEIKRHIGEKTHSIVTSQFSTTTPGSRAASEITLMSATKNYFSFGMTTACGIPNISLLGTEADWMALRDRAEGLGKLMTPSFAEYWMPLLLPLLDEFIESHHGNVNHGFWQSMVKLRHTGMGSGYSEFISGWMQILFPYLASGLNKNLRPWNESYYHGPKPEEFPSVISAVPVDWDYFGVTFNMDFFAGLGGVSQDPTDGALKPEVSWYVTHSPPMNVRLRLKFIRDEIKALLRGHKEEAEAKEVDATQPWFQRVQALREEASVLEKNRRSEPLGEPKEQTE